MATETRVLVTGGAGKLGSQICKSLQEAGLTPVILDNLQRYKESPPMDITLVHRDLLETGPLSQAMNKEKIKAVIHCGSLNSVEDSKSQPELYYKNNLDGLLSLLKAMQNSQVKLLIVSQEVQAADSPFARTQKMMGQILQDLQPVTDMKIAILSSGHSNDYITELKKHLN